MGPYDVPTLFRYREVLRGFAPGTEPTLVPLETTRAWRSVALLSGSFNPPTAAHQLLAERALLEGFDGVLFVLARETAGKRPMGLIAEDRLLALQQIAKRGRLVPAVCSHALYVEQAEAATRLFPGAEVAFLTGSDKVAQIFDERWYDEREQALRRLFDRAKLIVAPRASNGDAVREILSRADNARYAGRVEVLPLHPAVSDLSSTRVRGLLQAGADTCGLVPQPVANFVRAIGAFAPPRLVDDEEVDAYDVRVRLLDALWEARDWAESRADLFALWAVACSAGEDGRRMRRALRNGPVSADELARSQAAAG